MSRQEIISKPESSPWFNSLPGEQIKIRVSGDEVHGEYALLESVAEPMGGPPLHVHQNEDEIFHVLEGNVRFHIDGNVFDAQAGSVVVIPKGKPHAWQNLTDTQTRAMVTFMPSGFEKALIEFVGHTMQEIEVIANRYKSYIVGPPIDKTS